MANIKLGVQFTVKLVRLSFNFVIWINHPPIIVHAHFRKHLGITNRFMCSFHQVFDGENLTVVNIPSVRFIRFYPKTWQNEMCMRVQVYKEVGGVLTGAFNFLVCPRRHKGVEVLQRETPITTCTRLKGKKVSLWSNYQDFHFHSMAFYVPNWRSVLISLCMQSNLSKTDTAGTEPNVRIRGVRIGEVSALERWQYWRGVRIG